jgi:hypothetical protein
VYEWRDHCGLLLVHRRMQKFPTRLRHSLNPWSIGRACGPPCRANAPLFAAHGATTGLIVQRDARIERTMRHQLSHRPAVCVAGGVVPQAGNPSWPPQPLWRVRPSAAGQLTDRQDDWPGIRSLASDSRRALPLPSVRHVTSPYKSEGGRCRTAPSSVTSARSQAEIGRVDSSYPRITAAGWF